jgi:hypothetical protein
VFAAKIMSSVAPLKNTPPPADTRASLEARP